MLKIANHPIYRYALPQGHRFPMIKYELLPRVLIDQGICTTENFFEPQRVPPELILKVHGKEYYNRLINLSLDKKEINFEEFIAVKGIKAQGNQLTTDKIKQVNLLASLPYEEPEEQVVEEVEVVEEEVISTSEETPTQTSINNNTSEEENNTSDDGQITLF